MAGNVSGLNGFGPWILFRPWRAVSRVSMVYQAGRFAVVEVHLLSFVKNDANFDKSVGNSAKHALLIFTYLALLFCLGVPGINRIRCARTISNGESERKDTIRLRAQQERGEIELVKAILSRRGVEPYIPEVAVRYLNYEGASRLARPPRGSSSAKRCRDKFGLRRYG